MLTANASFDLIRRLVSSSAPPPSGASPSGVLPYTAPCTELLIACGQTASSTLVVMHAKPDMHVNVAGVELALARYRRKSGTFGYGLEFDEDCSRSDLVLALSSSKASRV